MAGRSIFHPAECFKGAVLVFGICWVVGNFHLFGFKYFSLPWALVLTAVPVFFGIIGLFEGPVE